MRTAAIIAGGAFFVATALATLPLSRLRQASGAPSPSLSRHHTSIVMLPESPEPVPSIGKISAWIRSVLRGNAAAQKVAKEKLLAAGDAAVGLLKQSRHESVSPQERQRFQSVLNDIALTDALHGPMVTFRSNNCSLHDALAAVCAQAGLGCQLPRNCKRLSEHLRINIQHQLFWNALLRIARVTGVSPDADYGPGLVFSRHGLFTNGALVAVNGAFAVVIKSTTLHHTKQRGKSGRRRTVARMICRTLYLPTKGTFIQVGSPKATLALNTNGANLPVASNLFSVVKYGIPPGDIISGYPGTLTAGPFDATSPRIIRLKLVAPVAVSLNPAIISADNLNSGRAEIDTGGMRFLFGKPKDVKGKWGVAMDASTPPWLAKSLPVQALLSRLSSFPHGPCFFTTADGRQLGNPSGFAHAYPSKRQYEFFPLDSKPAGVFVKTYARMVAVRVPFVFTNIPIPLSKTSAGEGVIPQPPMIISENIRVRSQSPMVTVDREVVMPAESRHFLADGAKISDWIADLSGKSHAARAAAGKKLILAGDAAVPSIKAALSGWTTPGMRRRMRSVLAEIAQADAVRGPLVTLKLKNAPLRTILQRLCMQAGFSAQFSDLHLAIAARRLTINVTQQPFWKVIQRIAMVTDVRPEGNDYWGAGLFTFSNFGVFNASTPVYTDGALLLAVQRSSTDQTITFDADRGHRSAGGFSLNITGLWALGDSQVVQLGPARFSRAVDNHGMSLLASAKASVEVPVSAVNYEFLFNPHLIWPFATSTTIRTLKGELPITLAVAPRIRRIGNLDSGHAVIQVDGLHIKWGKRTGVVENPLNPRLDRCSMHITVTPDANLRSLPATAFFMRSLPQNNSLAYTPSIGGVLGFQSQSGRQLSCRVGKHVNASGWSYEVRVRGGLPVTAWARVYTRFIRVHIPFSFHNLPIPGDSGVALKPMIRPKLIDRPVSIPGRLIMRGHPHRKPIQAGQLEHWIRELSSPSVSRRRAAARQLIIAGNKAIPPIQNALMSTADPPLRRKLLSILDSIIAAHDLRGPIVSLNMRHASVRAALTQLCSQVGIPAYYNVLPPSPLATYRIRHQPFWKAIQAIAAMTHVGPVANIYSNGHLRFGRRNLFASDVPVVIDGACALAIQSIRRYQTNWLVRVDPANKKRGFTASCVALWAPASSQILEQVGPLHATELITDPHGKLLRAAPVKTSQSIWPRKHDDVVFPLQLHLPWPPPNAASMALRGTLRMYLSGVRQTLQLNHLRFGRAALTDDGMNLRFGKPREISGGWKIRLHIGITQGFSYHGKTNHWLPFAQMPIERRFVHHLFDDKELRLYSGDGRRLRITGHRGGPLASRGWGYYRYTLNVAGAEPAKATMAFFTRTVLVKVPFDFRDLPIPR